MMRDEQVLISFNWKSDLFIFDNRYSIFDNTDVWVRMHSQTSVLVCWNPCWSICQYYCILTYYHLILQTGSLKWVLNSQFSHLTLPKAETEDVPPCTAQHCRFIWEENLKTLCLLVCFNSILFLQSICTYPCQHTHTHTDSIYSIKMLEITFQFP